MPKLTGLKVGNNLSCLLPQRSNNRLENACNQLSTTDDPVLEICFDSGYSTIAHFHQQFLRAKGMTPLQYRKRLAANGG